MKNEIFPLLPRTKNNVLVALAPVSCGEPGEICTELERVDLNEYLTGGQDGIYLIRANGDSMEHEIRLGDLMIVDRNQSPKPGEAVVALVNGDYTVKDYQPRRNGLTLIPKNAKYKSQIITRQDDFEIFGVVIGILRRFKKI
jgi:DNA polymerase V